MPRRDEILLHLDRLLEIHLVQDYGPNGLQVEGASEVTKIVTGVTACQELIEAARLRGAQMLVVHHGIFWNHQSSVLRGALLRRIQTLLASNISLLAYHLPLDRHPEVGNNAPALRDLGLIDLQPFAMSKGVSVGWRGRFETPLSPEALVTRLEHYYEAKATAFLHGPPTIASLGLVSGAAQGEAQTAVNLGLDAFITGEISEYNFHLAKEERLHHISLGHHATERIGPRRLAAHLRTTFNLDAEFIDIQNPV